MTAQISNYQSRTTSMDNVFGTLLRPAWPFLEANRHRQWVKQLPNILTTVRLIISVPIAIQLGQALAAGNDPWAITFWSLAIVGLFVSDGLDGTLANRLQIVSGYGRIVDPVADKVLVLGLLIIFVRAGNLLLPPPLTNLLASFVVIRVIIDAILVSITFVEATRQRAPKADRWGKRKLAADGLTAILLAVGLGLTACGNTSWGCVLVRIACVVIVVAVYLGLHSIRGHWLNLRGPTTAA